MEGLKTEMAVMKALVQQLKNEKVRIEILYVSIYQIM